MHAYDFQEPYLRTIFGFIGITDIDFIMVQPTDVSSLRDAAFASAVAQAQSLAGSSKWIPQQAPTMSAVPEPALPVALGI
jgi:FMN-dependent NADH-azoreductase